MSLSPYLHFDGTCEQALRFYAAVFGDPSPQFMAYDQMPDAPPNGAAGRILHGQVVVAGGLLLASDAPPGMQADPQAGVSISADLPDEARARAAFDRLAEGGEILMPFEATFFSPGFGMVKDRFGTHWMVSISEAA